MSDATDEVPFLMHLMLQQSENEQLGDLPESLSG